MSLSPHKPFRLGIRVQPENRLTLPVILHYLESIECSGEFEIEIIDTPKKLDRFTGDPGSSLLLYSFMTTRISEVALEISRIKKRRQKNLILVAGGPHTQGDPVSSLKLGFDYAFTGAVEMGFGGFLESAIENKLPGHPAVIRLAELDNLDNSFPLSGISKTSPPLEITRGCYWNCRFCQTACQRTRHRSMTSIREYCRILKERRHIARINFICPSAFEYGSSRDGHPKEAVIEELLSLFKENGTRHLEFGIFPTETRPNTFSDELVRIVKKYCSNRQLTIGAQSGSDDQLKKIRRGHTVEDIKSACQITAENGLQPHVDLIFGFPEETKDHRRETLSLIRELHQKYGARTHLHYFIPLSGTDMADSYPRELDYRSLDTVGEIEKGGICTDWWREGKKLSGEVVRMRDKLRSVEISYGEINLPKV